MFKGYNFTPKIKEIMSDFEAPMRKQFKENFSQVELQKKTAKGSKTGNLWNSVANN